jgi:hypothetical protein
LNPALKAIIQVLGAAEKNHIIFSEIGDPVDARFFAIMGREMFVDKFTHFRKYGSKRKISMFRSGLHQRGLYCHSRRENRCRVQLADSFEDSRERSGSQFMTDVGYLL